MTTAETYQLHPEWGALTMPLIKYLGQKNGVAGTSIDKLHALALAQIQNVSVPGKKHEDWKYTPLRELMNLKFAEPVLPGNLDVLVAPLMKELRALNIIVVNGQYIPHLTDKMPDGVWMGTLQEAIKQKGPGKLLDSMIARLEGELLSPFEALTTSMTNPGLCLSIDPNIHFDQPIHFIHISDYADGAGSYAYPYKLIGVGRNASVQIIESFISLTPESSSFTNSVNHIQVEEGGRLMHYRLQHESPESFHINMTRVYQEKDSTYESVAAELGAKLMRNNISAIHKGTGVTSNLYGLFMADDRQHTDTQTFIDHAQPHCVSNELYKGILDGYARGVFNGKIMVRPDAQKTNAFQQNNALILSKDAIMDSKPQLEIFADDVKCSHGATIGQLDENALFYLRSRGLTQKEASALLERAFVREVLDKCKNEDIRNFLNEKVDAHQHA